MPLEVADQRLLAERPVHQHRLAAVGSQRQQPVFRLAVEDVVGELHEVERLALHPRLHLVVTAAVRGGYAAIPESPLILPLLPRTDRTRAGAGKSGAGL